MMLECCSFRLATPQQERSWSAKNIKVHSSCMQMCILAGHPRFLIIPQVLAPSLEKCRWSIIKRMWCEKKGEKKLIHLHWSVCCRLWSWCWEFLDKSVWLCLPYFEYSSRTKQRRGRSTKGTKIWSQTAREVWESDGCQNSVSRLSSDLLVIEGLQRENSQEHWKRRKKQYKMWEQFKCTIFSWTVWSEQIWWRWWRSWPVEKLVPVAENLVQEEFSTNATIDKNKVMASGQVWPKLIDTQKNEL